MKTQPSRKSFFWVTIISVSVIILSLACALATEEPERSALSPTKYAPVPQIPERLPVQIKTLEGYQTPPPTKSIGDIVAFGPTLPPPIQETIPATIGALGGNQVPTSTPTEKVPCSEIATDSDNSTPPRKVFSLTCANTVPPENVLDEVNFGGTGGGDGKPECNSPDDAPLLKFVTKTPDWLAPITIYSCRWGRQQEIQVNITTSDNRVLGETVLSNDITPGFLEYVFYPTIDSQPGWYVFNFKGYYGELTVNVYVTMPDGSRMYFIENLGAYYLYGFFPNEQIRFFYYGGRYPKYQLKGWADYIVDENGRLLIKVPANQGYYVAVGSESGVVGNRYKILK